MPPECVRISVSPYFEVPLPSPLKWTLVGAGQRERSCSGVPGISGLGSYLEFLRIFSRKSSGLGGREPGFNTNSLTLRKLLPSLALHSSSEKWANESICPLSFLPSFGEVVRNLWLLKLLGLQVVVCDRGLHRRPCLGVIKKSPF